jgi:hypothetical protein
MRAICEIVLFYACCVVTLAVFAAEESYALQPSFRFQNNFWVNLHATLRGEARRRSLNLAAQIEIGGLTDAERKTWSSALDAYEGYGQKNVIFDEALVRLNNWLSTISNIGGLSPIPNDIDARTVRALIAAAPVYRRHFWPEQSQINMRWIAAVQPLVTALGSSMASGLAGVYRVDWPAAPIVVDASFEAGADGGYTTDGPLGTAAHTVIQTSNTGYQGEAGFEMIFHEACHAETIEQPLTTAINTEAAQQNVKAAPNLWHAIIFYTAGELARRELQKNGVANYQPYANRNGIWDRGWQPLREAIERDWQPYLDGRATFDSAIQALVRHTSQAK